MAGRDEATERSELEMLRLKANQRTDDSLDSTRRMLQLCEDAQGAGIKTVVQLDMQGAQLDRVEEDLEKINADLKEAEKNLSAMERCCGICPRWKRNKGFKQSMATWKDIKSSNDSQDGRHLKVIEEQPGRSASNHTQPGTRGGYVVKITGDDREAEMDENLGQVSSIIGNLRNLAIDMGNEIESQNRQLDRLSEKGISNVHRVEGAHKRATKLLKK